MARRFAFGSNRDVDGDSKNAEEKVEKGEELPVTMERLQSLVEDLFLILQRVMPSDETTKGKGVGNLHGFESIHPKSLMGVINIFRETIEQAEQERKGLEQLGVAAASPPGQKLKMKKASALVGMRIRSKSQTQSAKKRRKPAPARLRAAANSVLIVGPKILRITSSQSRKKEILHNLRTLSEDGGGGGGGGGGHLSTRDLMHKLNARTMRSKHKKWSSKNKRSGEKKAPKPPHPRKHSIQKRIKRKKDKSPPKGIDAASANVGRDVETEKSRLDDMRANHDEGDEHTEVTKVADPEAKSYSLSVLLDTAKEKWPPGIDPSKRESYLSQHEFREVFKMTKGEWGALPKWKQVRAKKSAGLF